MLTICLQIESPRPVPCLFLYEFSVSLPKLTKRFYRPCSEIPMPVSIIDRLKLMKHSYPALISCLLSSSYFLEQLSTILESDRPLLQFVLCFINLFNSFGFILFWFFCMSVMFIQIIISPSLLVNLTAFDKKFNIIWRNLRLSPQI